MSYYFKKGTNQKYGVLGACRIKMGNHWLEGVVYLRDGKTYVRLKDDFEHRFEEE